MRCVRVLVRTHQNYVLETFESIVLAELIEVTLSLVCRVAHRELLDRHGLLYVFDEPHACVDQRRRVIHVAQVGRPKRHVPVEVLLVETKVLQSLSDYDATKRVANECQLR